MTASKLMRNRELQTKWEERSRYSHIKVAAKLTNILLRMTPVSPVTNTKMKVPNEVARVE